MNPLRIFFDTWYVNRLLGTTGGKVRFALQLVFLLAMAAGGIILFFTFHHVSRTWYLGAALLGGGLLALVISYIESYVYMRNQPLDVATFDPATERRQASLGSLLDIVNWFSR